MPVRKIVEVGSNGVLNEYAGKQTSAGASDAGELVALGAGGKLDPSLLPNGVGADATTATAGEDLASGDFVYFNAAGAVFKADATAIAKAARGYVLAAVANGATATVYFDENNSSVTGLTAGATYFLSATPGAVATTPPIAAGNIVQQLGFASSATAIHVNIQEAIIRA